MLTYDDEAGPVNLSNQISDIITNAAAADGVLTPRNGIYLLGFFTDHMNEPDSYDDGHSGHQVPTTLGTDVIGNDVRSIGWIPASACCSNIAAASLVMVIYLHLPYILR